MTAAVALLTAALLSALVLTALTQFEKALREAIGSQQFTLVSSLAKELDGKIEHARSEMVGLAALLPLDLLERPTELQRFLEKHQRWGHFDGALAVLSTGGQVLAFSPTEAELGGKDLSFRPHFRQTMAIGQPQISDPFISVQRHGHPVIVFTAPVFDRRGEIAAVMSGSIDLLKENFLGQIARTRLGDGGYLYLYSIDRTLIVHPDHRRILQRDVPPGSNRLFDLAIEGFEGSGETVTSRGLQAFSSFKRLQSRDWILAANYPVAEGLAAVAETRRFMLAALTAFTVLALLVTWSLMGYLSAPLLALTGRIRRMTADESLRAPVPVAGSDEIGTLAQAFNRLLEETEDRKRALQDNLLFHQALIETIPVPIWYKDRQGFFLGANSAFAEQFGVEKETLAGKTVYDIAPPERAEEYFAADNALWRDGGVQVYETQSLRADGGERDVIAYKAPFFDSAGQVAGLVGTLLDITERKRIEAELSAQKEFSENLLQNSPVASFVIDRRHRITHWNRACEELTGLAAAEMIGTDGHWRAFYPGHRPCLADLVLEEQFKEARTLYHPLEPSALNPEGVQTEAWFDRLGGRPRHIVFSAAPIRSGAGEIVAAVETLQDFTSHQQMRNNLQRAHDFYLTLFEEFPALIWRAGLGTDCNYMNQTWLQFTGRSLEEELGDGWTAGIHPEDREERLTAYRQAFADRRPFSLEYRLRRFDGQYRWILDMGRPFDDLEGEFAGYLGVCFDISEQRETLEKLKILSRTIEQSTNAVIVTDAASRIEYVNPEFTRQSGYTAAEAIGRDPHRLLSAGLPGAQSAEEHRQLQQALQRGETWLGEFLNRRKDGSLYWCIARISPIQNDRGEVTHFVAVQEDVSEKKTFQQSHYRRRVMRDAATDALHTFLQTSSHYAMAHVLLQCCLDLLQAPLGFLAQTESGQLSFLALAGSAFRPEERQPLEGRIRRLTGRGESAEEPVALSPDLEALFALPFCLEPLRIADRELGLVGLFGKPDGFTLLDRQDLESFASVASLALQSAGTEQARQQAVDHLRAVQKFEAIGQLAGGVAHDFNNLLTVINGYGALLVKSLEKDETSRRDAEMILQAGRKAENLTRQMLAFSRRQVLEPVVLDLNQLIGGFHKLLLRLVRENQEVVWKPSPELARVKADPSQLEQILINLVVNARDALPAGGQIVLETADVQLDDAFVSRHPGARPGEFVMLSVTDHGIGMSEEVRERVFEPFFTTKAPGLGTGLGLATVYGIVKQSAGYITVASTPGRGSRFCIYFPATREIPTATGKVEPPDVLRRRGNILLVEDDREVLTLTATLLERQGFTVLATSRPQDAPALLAGHPQIDLLLTDMVLPGLDGPELARQLRRSRPQLKILFMSGHGQFHGGDLPSLGEGTGFLQKPFSPAALYAKIQGLLTNTMDERAESR